MDVKHIENVFFEQIKQQTLGSLDSYDYQFSDRWLDDALSKEEYSSQLRALKTA
ncbi:MAG: hypothetical protein ACQESC_01575 [Nanobdellota archaeon]